MSRKYLSIDKLKKRASARQKLVKQMETTDSITSSSLVLPPYGSVKKYCPDIYDQGQLGSCTANAFCGAYRILENIKNGRVDFQPSRLYLYYKEREIEGTVDEDSGADVIDGESYVQYYGICSEDSWPYDIEKYTVQPPVSCDQEALDHKISSYRTIPLNSSLLTNIKKTINSQIPVMIAIAVYESFESQSTAQTGVVTIPKKYEQCLGGHEMCIVGYNDSAKLFTVLNSWGPEWGQAGFCYIPYSYITNHNLAFEFTYFNL